MFKFFRPKRPIKIHHLSSLPITKGKECLIDLKGQKIGKLLIEAEVLDKISGYRQNAPSIVESGGCLLGFYRPPHIHITHMTTPMPEDIRSRLGFCRKDKRHIEIIRNFQQKTKTGTYIGEWHTHPEQVPSPSYIDKKNWCQIFNLRTPTDSVLLIMGTTHISLYLV